MTSAIFKCCFLRWPSQLSFTRFACFTSAIYLRTVCTLSTGWLIFPHGLSSIFSSHELLWFLLTWASVISVSMSFCDFSQCESLRFVYSTISDRDSSPRFLTGFAWSLSAISVFTISAICRTESYLSVFAMSLCCDFSLACLFMGLTSLCSIWSLCEFCRWLLTVLSLDLSLWLNSVWVLMGG